MKGAWETDVLVLSLLKSELSGLSVKTDNTYSASIVEKTVVNVVKPVDVEKTVNLVKSERIVKPV